MHGDSAKESISFVPRQTINQECVNDNPTNEEPTCSPSNIFQRYGSLAELSTVAITEKEALDRQENWQSSDGSEPCLTIDVVNEIQSQDYICLSQAVGAQLEVKTTPTKIAPPVESTPCNDPLTPTANLKMLISVISPAIRDRDEKKRDLFVNNGQNFSEEGALEKPNAYNRKDKSLGLLCQRYVCNLIGYSTHCLCSIDSE